MRSKFFVVVLFLAFSTVAMAQTTGRDAFLDVWTLKDNSAHIEIIRSEGKYYIIEFVHLKYELFFSGDEKRAMFYDWGKGEPGLIGLQIGDGNQTITLFGVSDTFKWVPSYIFYKKP